VFVLKIMVTLGLLALVVYQVDISLAAKMVLELDPAWLGLATVLYGLTFVIGGIRWKNIVDGLDNSISLGFSVATFYISGFFSQVMIGGGYGGDVYRVWALKNISGNPLSAFATVLIDRLSGLISAAILVAALAPVFSVVFPSNGAELQLASFICAAIALVFFLSIWLLGKPAPDNRFVQRVTRLVPGKLVEFRDYLARGFFEIPLALIHLGWSVVALAINMLALVCIGVAVGLELSAWVYFVIGPVVFLAKSFPLSVAGWGAREAAMAFFFGFAGVAGEKALLMSLLSGILVLAATLPAAAMWVSARRNGTEVAE